MIIESGAVDPNGHFLYADMLGPVVDACEGNSLSNEVDCTEKCPCGEHYEVFRVTSLGKNR